MVFSKSTFASLLAIASALPQPQSLNRRQQEIPPPIGDSTSNVPRPKVGNVPYGPTIRSCTVPNTVALTFDDGPNEFTSDLLDIFAEYNDAHATFFVAGWNGRNLDCAGSYGPLLNRMRSEGHQVGSHTWTHPSLNGESQADFNSELWLTEQVIRNHMGVFPTYLRPPYLECDATCESRAAALGYHVIGVNLDTNDWRYQDPSTIQQALDNFDNGLTGRNIVLAHDIHRYTVFNLARHMIETAQGAGYRLVTTGECLGDPEANWYRDGGGPVCGSNGGGGGGGGGGGSNPPPAGDLEVTPDGQCGGSSGFTCAGSFTGGCCSEYGWCGVDPEHCAAGCQEGFGDCDSDSGNGGGGGGNDGGDDGGNDGGNGGGNDGGDLEITPTGQCGIDFGFTCAGSFTGGCCSEYGWCGTENVHCGAGCQEGYGDCGTTGGGDDGGDDSPPLESSPTGECGGSTGWTCEGSSSGGCCSEYGWCGVGDTYCGAGCQQGFGASCN